MALIKLWLTLLALLISQTVTLFALPDDANIWKAPKQHTAKQAQLEVIYENYSDNMLPVLSRDLTLLGQAVEMIRNDECRYQCKSMLDGIRNLTSWAVRFYDSSGKFPEGILGGSSYQLGNFDECLQIGQADDSPPGIYGQYCLGEVGIEVPDIYLKNNGTIWEDFRPSVDRGESITKLHWGICVPAACEPRDVEGVVRTVLAVAFSGSRLKLTPRIPEESCYKITPQPYNNLDIAYTCVVLTLTLLLIVGTTFHLRYLMKKENLPEGRLPQVLLGFSIILNVKKLSGDARANGSNLTCISGIKVIAMVVILVGHSMIFLISGPVLNLRYWEHALTEVKNSVLLNNPLLVDTFLLLSGFLVSCLILHELNKGRSINFLLVYLQRYIRLTPAYLIVIGLYVTWFPRLDSGPMWSRVYAERDRCMESWWSNLLYINNYVNTDNLCMFQSWYLSVDTQLFMLSPLLVYPLHKWPKIGEYLLGGTTLLSVIIPFAVTLRNEADPTIMVHSAELKDISTNYYFINYYIKTHMRASAYCFGLTFGYIVHRMHLTNEKLSPSLVRFGWFFASISLVASMTTIVLFYGPRKNYTPIEAAIYAALHRVFWSLGTGWVILACVTGNGGIVARFLEWKGFLPLSRLTYSAYLMNGMVELHNVGTVKSPQYLDYVSMTRRGIADVVATFICALVLSITCESPILGLEKILLTRGNEGTKGDKKGGGKDRNSTEA